MKHIKIIFLLTILFSLPINGQIEGEAIYVVKRSFNYDSLVTNTNNKQKIINQYKKIDDYINNQTFKLRFKKGISHFILEDKLDVDNSTSKLKFVNSMFPENYYSFSSKKNWTVQKGHNKNGYLVETNINNQKIDLHNSNYDEVINGFACSKATVSFIKEGKEKEKYQYYVWYMKEVSIPFGPLIYNNMPGLIVRVLEADGTIIELKNFKLVRQKEIIMPNDLEFISEEDYNEIINQSLNNFKPN